MGKLIYLPDPIKKEMEKTFKTTKVSLWNALNFKTNSDFARMLRAAALQRGGVTYDSQKATPGQTPDYITIFETSDNIMTQILNDRIYLVADLSTGDVTVYVDGEMMQKYQNVYLHQLANIRTSAQNLVK